MAHKAIRRAGGPPPGWRAKLRGWVRELAPHHVSPTRLALAIGCVCVYTALLAVDLFQAGITWQVGEYAEHDVYADQTHEFVDEEATAKLRQAARGGVAKQYDVLPVASEAIAHVKQFYEYVNAVAGDPTLPTVAEKVGDLSRRLVWISLEPEPLAWVLQQTAPRRAQLTWASQVILTRVYKEREIRDDAPQDLDDARAAIDRQLQGFAPADRAFLAALLESPDVLKPNRRFNREATEAARQKAAEETEPVRRTITRGQLIVQRGHRVTDENLRDLRALGLVQPRRDYRELFALGCLVSLVLLVLGNYVRLELPQIYYDNRRVFLLNLVAALALLLFRFLLWLKGELPAVAHPAILCGAATSMVIAVLIEYRLAMMMTGALALFMGVLLPGAGLWVAFEAWLAGRVGAMSLRHVKNRSDLARAGLMVSLAGMLIAAAAQVPRLGDLENYQAQHLSTDLLFGFGWGMLAFLLAQGLIPLLERPFACVTPFRLLELTNTSTPLLQELKRRARGTFDASLTIGDMAADACEAIGADPLLARACGYHHDIGKLKHPAWFIENLFGGQNVHERLEPTMSAMAIKSHVSEGLQLGREHQLPQPLLDVIGQHHGTTMISFFYYQALERAPEGEKVPEEQFRYEGPKPQFKESGIIMLADGIEAAVRAASGHGSMSEKKIAEIVAALTQKRLEEGQLDECDLTLRDLKIASQAFIDFLRGMYHNRIEYPAQAMKLKGRREGNGA